MARAFLTAIDLSKNELQNAAVQNLGTAPSSPVKGQLYYDTTGNILYWWDGTAWQSAKAGAAFPGYGSVPAETTFGIAKSDGVATTVARSDHTHGSPTHDAAAHSTIPLSALAVPTGPVSFNSQRITSLGTPSAGTDATTKDYVDNLTAGLSWKQAVRVASTADMVGSGLIAVDGVTVASGDRVLMKNQASGQSNGIWIAGSGLWTRAPDMDTGAEAVNACVFVSEGATQADTAWVQTTNAPITLGTTAQVWVQFAGSGASVPLTRTISTTLPLTGGGDLSANRTLAINNFGTGTAGAVPSSPGGTTAFLRADGTWASPGGGGTVNKFAVDCSAATSTTVTHSLGSQDVTVAVYRKTTPWDEVDCDVEHTSTTQCTVRFATAPTAGQYRIVVTG